MADNLDAQSWLPDQLQKQAFQRLTGVLHPRWHQTRSNHGGLEQAQIVAAKIEELLQVVNLH